MSAGSGAPDAPGDAAAVALAAAALFALPFESDRLAVAAGPLTVTIPEALVAAAVVATAAAALARREALLVDRKFAAAAALVVAALAASALLAPEHRANAIKFVLRMGGGAAFGLAACRLARRGAGWRLAGAYAAGVAAAAAVGLAEWLAGARLEPALSLFREGPVFAAGVARVTSTYGYPNTLATSVAMALPVLVAGAARARGPLRAACGAAVAVSAGSLVLTYSRGGLLATAAGLAALAFLSRRTGEGRRVAAASLAAAAAVGLCWGALASVDALATRGGTGDSGRELLGARIEPAVARAAVAGGRTARMPVRVTNSGALEWRSTAEAPFALTYRWYGSDGRRLGGEGVRTPLPAVVAPGESVTLDAVYHVPAERGRLLLVWDLYIERRLRFGEQGSAVGLVEVFVGRDEDEARRLARDAPPAAAGAGQGAAAPYVPPTRAALWRAALAMFAERPLAGWGPDSYRLRYGRYLGLEEWDVRVYANSLPFELLATTGAAGALAFAWLLAVVAGRALARARSGEGGLLAAVALGALAAFAAHGLVDYFLAFTAGYVPFWLFCGLAAAERTRPRARGEEAADARR